MQQLSELDSSFLYLETETSPLHVGGVFVFKKKNAKSAFNFNRFRTLIESKLGNERFFRSRIVETPLKLDLPIWADDPDFDLARHLDYVTLKTKPAPCTLNELAATVFSSHLDRAHPLWHATYVDGLENDPKFSKSHFALILKIHLTAIDGTTGEDILSQLLHVSPEIADIEPAEPWTPLPLPDTGSLLDAAYSNALNIPSKLALLAKDTAASIFYSTLQERLQGLNLPAALMKVAPTPINQSISSKRIIDNICIPVTQIRDIRQELADVTTNDVIMGICAEALANYLSEDDAKVQAPLIALAPISVRSTSLDVKSGNQLAASLFSLATTETNPIERIRLIHQTAQLSNHYADAISAARLTELIPSCMTALSARVYSEFLLAQKHMPMFNLPITNIPGPQFPLYLEDNELSHYICTGPLFDGIGLGIMIVSYNGMYSITTTYCPELVTNKKPFGSYLNAALESIVNAKDKMTAATKSAKFDKEASGKGIIEDVVGLVNNLFSFTEKK